MAALSAVLLLISIFFLVLGGAKLTDPAIETVPILATGLLLIASSLILFCLVDIRREARDQTDILRRFFDQQRN